MQEHGEIFPNNNFLKNENTGKLLRESGHVKVEFSLYKHTQLPNPLRNIITIEKQRYLGTFSPQSHAGTYYINYKNDG